MTTVRLTRGDAQEVEQYGELVSEFMHEVFSLLPGQYFLTDDTQLSDLHLRCPDMANRIHKTYGIKPTLDTRIVRVLEAIRITRAMPRH